MSEGVWPIGRIDVGQLNAFSGPRTDGFRQLTGAAVGLAGIVLGTAGRAGRVYRVVAQNAGATPYFLQIHNRAVAPVNAEVPVYVQRLPASGECIIDLAPVGGLVCPAGVCLALSSTPGTLTLAVAPDLAFYTAIITQRS